MRLKIQLTCYLILIASIFFTGFEIFKTLNNFQNTYLQKLEVLKKWVKQKQKLFQQMEKI